MLTMFLRAAILYVFVIAVVRGMGKRQIGEMQPYELAITILIADLASAPMGSPSIPLLHGVLPIAALLVLQSLLTLATLKSDKLRSWINGKPSILVRDGVIDEKELRRQALSLSELLEEARIAGVSSLSQIGFAVLEVSGDLSVYPLSQNRPVTPADMGISTEYEGMTLALVLDGSIQAGNLKTGCLSEEWLLRQLSKIKMDAREVLVCTLDTSGMLYAQKKGSGAVTKRQALNPKEVRW